MSRFASLEVLQSLVRAPGPPGQEGAIRDLVAGYVAEIGLTSSVDGKGNLKVTLGQPNHIVVTAHLDEIALMVTSISATGKLKVRALGGLHPWKLGECAVDILGSHATLPGILGFGSIHTEDPRSNTVRARNGALKWDDAEVFTGLSASALAEAGVRVGTRVVIASASRDLVMLPNHVAGRFLDDRADLAAWLIILEAFKGVSAPITFLATTSEEVGGEGALYHLTRNPADICIALELGANVPDAPVELSASPTVWMTDSYSQTTAADADLLHEISKSTRISLQYQAFSRGGSDASCAASHGLCARPITLGLPMDNSHGLEIMHAQAIPKLAEFTIALLQKLIA